MKLLALDGNSIINRAFYGIRPLSTKDGIFTNGIYGFLNILLKLKEDVSPDMITAAFDLRAPTFRHNLYAEYKAGRKQMPEELAMQMPIIKDILRQMGCCVLEKEGYEADDILGTLARKADENGDECIIATGDRDSLQLVSNRVTVMLAATKAGRPEVTVYNKEKIALDYGVTPAQLIEIKALQGDSSDNIPGVAGIGAKTAAALIGEYHSIDAIYDRLDELEMRDTLREKLRAGKEQAYLSRTLGTICREVPVDIPTRCEQDMPALKATLLRLEMNRLIERLSLTQVNAKKPSAVHSAAPDTVKTMFKTNDTLPDGSIVYFDENRLYAKHDGSYYVFEGNIKQLLDGTHDIIVHDCKSMYHAFKPDFRPNIAFDTMLAAYLINPDKNDYSLEKYEANSGICRHDGEYSDAADRLDICEWLYLSASKEISENGQDMLLHEVEIPLAYTLYRMETEGFEIDAEGITEFSKRLNERARELEAQIYEIIGHEINLNSPKQLGFALFEELGLPHGKKTKTGFSTDAQVLESLRYDFDIVEFILEYRSVTKLKSTYCDGLLKAIGADGRVHSTFRQTETRTGRISSSEPNLQNIPVRTQLGREMRHFFRAKSGWLLADADYSQIELRVLASVADDSRMIQAFNNGDDIHTITASQVFGVPLENVTGDMRNKAKAVNFGIVYGIGAFSLSKDIKVSVAQAKRYIDGYLATYDGVDGYMTRVVEHARRDGFVSTEFNRRRYLPELAMSNHNMRAFGERVARNMPIQGMAADIIKIAMNKVFCRLEKEKLQARLILQIHDELIVEAPESEIETVSALLREEMEAAVKLKVKMTAEVKTGKTWFETK